MHPVAIRHLALWVLLVPALLLAVLPAGLMPTRLPAGGFGIVLCTGDGPVTVTLDPRTGRPLPDTGDGGGGGDGRWTGICPWQAVQAIGLPPSRACAAPSAAVRLAAEPAPESQRHAGAAEFGLRPPARAPPVLS